mmetsp:Transcript_43832/g.139696  ORF Transcript_43832/g.139696 Transcript_43832/m.139696 type:complete len:114 (+) Transcript_43832:148-489(+)|eukprot:CAMPEP_0182855196 /NCGR_PEP_ID=MMETSP0034_2-20130328/1706_1 /TAXON_ID=156128 /ORGANISM="Nephroselmis pyriformis, Strain CCMP717" /LENGTH=113 /DNA_ID=CAMNT_0024986129 /DNA_START=161 /DNA_END=502 /DNA_ORIENTATION=+
MAAFAATSVASSMSFKASVAAPLRASSTPVVAKVNTQTMCMASRKNPKKEKAERNKVFARLHRKGGNNKKRTFGPRRDRDEEEAPKNTFANPFSYFTYDKQGRAVPIGPKADQ